MNLGEARPFFNNFEEESAKITDTRTRIWYEVEMPQRPEYIEATSALQGVQKLTSTLVAVQEVKNHQELNQLAEPGTEAEAKPQLTPAVHR